MTGSDAIDKIALMWPIRIIAAALTATVILMPVDGARAQQTDACNCDDLNSLKRFLTKSAGWRDELTRGLTNPASSLNLDAPYSRDVMHEFETQNEMQREVDFLPTYPSNFPGNPGATTDWGPPPHAGAQPICETHFPEGVSKCILRAIAAHENVHVLACHKFNGDGSHQSMREAIQEEIEAYNAGWKFAQAQKHKLECTCPYYAIQLLTSLEFHAPGGAGHSSGTVTIPLKFQEDGSYTGKGPMSVTATEKSTGCILQAENLSFNTLINGTVDGPEGSTRTHIDISMDSVAGRLTGVCFGSPINIPIGDSSTAPRKGHLVDMPALVGSRAQVAGLSSTYTATIVEMPAKAALTQDVANHLMRLSARGIFRGLIPIPDALPNCKN